MNAHSHLPTEVQEPARLFHQEAESHLLWKGLAAWLLATLVTFGLAWFLVSAVVDRLAIPAAIT